MEKELKLKWVWAMCVGLCELKCGGSRIYYKLGRRCFKWGEFLLIVSKLDVFCFFNFFFLYNIPWCLMNSIPWCLINRSLNS